MSLCRVYRSTQTIQGWDIKPIIVFNWSRSYLHFIYWNPSIKYDVICVQRLIINLFSFFLLYVLLDITPRALEQIYESSIGREYHLWCYLLVSLSMLSEMIRRISWILISIIVTIFIFYLVLFYYCEWNSNERIWSGSF